MPLIREFKSIPTVTFKKPLRAIFSGSSESGKTYLIGQILKNQRQIFGEDFASVKYFFPEFLDEAPVNFHEEVDISYQQGPPTKEDILSIPKNSLVILDDMADFAVKSALISQIFKVISGKNNLSIILVTQNYFIQGKFSREIRNSCNYVALFRNCADASLNKRVATAFGLKDAYLAAEKDVYQTQVYPYFFIDQTQRAQLSNYRLYTQILGQFKIAYSTEGMRGYILSEKDLLSAFRIVEEKKLSVLVVNKNENQKRPLSEPATGSKDKRKKKRHRVETNEKTDFNYQQFE